MNTINAPVLILVSLTESMTLACSNAEKNIGTLTDEYLKAKQQYEDARHRLEAAEEKLPAVRTALKRADEWYRDARQGGGMVSLSDDDIDTAIEAVEAEMAAIQTRLLATASGDSRGKERLKLLQQAGEKAALLMVLLDHQKI
jgi:chromosome segregation ATPase